MPPPTAMKVKKEVEKKAVCRTVKVEPPVPMKAMKVAPKKTAMKVEKPLAMKSTVKAENVEAPVTMPGSDQKTATPGTGRRRKIATKVDESSEMQLPGPKQKRARAASSVSLVDSGGPTGTAAVDALNCLAQLQKALAVPIAEPISDATPQRPTAVTEKASPLQQAEPFFSSSQVGSVVEPGEVIIGGNFRSWTCGCQAHLRRHPRCNGEGPVRVHLTRNVTVVGRGENCHVALRSIKTPQMISRNHAIIRHENSSFVVADQGSLNGVFVNGERVHGERPIRSGDIVTFGAPIAEPEFDYIFEERNNM
eukprot:gnl/MRDRNA2_/MRDRNA2_110136_c0_seq1.p1 gnl/MRDRNA2_/MRDRNA2_110136_c0~~gnl/MRDRNA2_/MRDRNA2_110136_c0_seq1.p1  ORF type:complete len:308 (-),score=68.90 gnl/MRDRNA2_/MRDRNA2_110136_c0_seq1:151-1074(-)